MRTGICKHFNGIQDTLCDAGLDMRAVTGGAPTGWTRRMPCFSSNGSEIQCERYEEPTADDLAQHEADFEAAMERLRLVGPLVVEIKREHKGLSWSGTRECPVCKGVLHLSHSAYNGHVHVRCETEGCLAWME